MLVTQLRICHVITMQCLMLYFLEKRDVLTSSRLDERFSFNSFFFSVALMRAYPRSL